MAKPIPGPTFRMDDALPCGCRVTRDEGTLKLRLWYCATHAAAFEILEVLRFNVDALGHLMKQDHTGDEALTRAMDAEMRARAVIRKATAGI